MALTPASSVAQDRSNSGEGRPGVLTCGAHIGGAEAFRAPLLFVESGGRLRAERPTGSRPGRNRFEASVRPDGQVSIRGTGGYDDGHGWRWVFAGDGSEGGRVVTTGYMFEAGRDGVERRARNCTLTLDLPDRTTVPPPVAKVAEAPRIIPPAAPVPARTPFVQPAAPERPRPPVPAVSGTSEPAAPTGSGSAIASIPCSAFYRMDRGLTDESWRLASSVPLDHLTPRDVQELKRVTGACSMARNPTPTYAEHDAVRRVRDGLDKLERSARQRADTERMEANARAEMEAAAKARTSIEEQIAGALRNVASKPPTERCSPSADDFRSSLVDTFGYTTFAKFGESTPAWSAYRRNCADRETLASEEETSRARADLERRVVAFNQRLTGPDDQVCNPPPIAIQAELIASVGVPAFRSFATDSPAWAVLTRECAARTQRAAVAALENAKAAFAQRLASANRAQMVKPLDEACSPSPASLQAELAGQFGREITGQMLANSNDWIVLTNDCRRRDARVEAARVQDAQRRAADLQGRRKKVVADQVEAARTRHAGDLAALGIPARLLDTRFVLEISPLFLGGWSFETLTLADWIALIADAQPGTRITGARDPATGNAGFTIKRPSERSTTYFVRLDGDELFATKVQIDDIAVPVEDVADRAAVANQLLVLAALPDLIARAQEIR